MKTYDQIGEKLREYQESNRTSTMPLASNKGRLSQSGNGDYCFNYGGINILLVRPGDLYRLNVPTCLNVPSNKGMRFILNTYGPITFKKINGILVAPGVDLNIPRWYNADGTLRLPNTPNIDFFRQPERAALRVSNPILESIVYGEDNERWVPVVA